MRNETVRLALTDYSIGNLSVPTPENLNDIFKNLLDTMDSLKLED